MTIPLSLYYTLPNRKGNPYLRTCRQQKNLRYDSQVTTCARRFELPTPWSVAKCSIQLSYAHIFFYRDILTNAGDRNRTGTVFLQQDFKSCASASSATPACNTFFTGTNRARTYDPLLVRQMLSQLSYDPIFLLLTTPAGLEPATSAVTGRRSNQLSHEALLLSCFFLF